MTDPIADMATRIRNALKTGKDSCVVPYSSFKMEILKVLQKTGYVHDLRKTARGSRKLIDVTLAYAPGRRPMISEIRRISKPGKRVYRGRGGIISVRSGLGVSVVSTPRGVKTGGDAIGEGVGGEVLLEIF